MDQSPPAVNQPPYLSCGYVSPLLLSSWHLNTDKPAQTGKIDVFEALKKATDGEEDQPSCVQLAARPPSKKLILEWKEVLTPAIPSTMHDLVGKKLANYKFQYLGRFFYGEEPVAVAKEHFTAAFSNGEAIYDCEVELDNWVNCTWLIDFLMNAKAICADTLRKEQLHWHKEGKKGHFIDISRVETDGRSQEQQHFIFKEDYQKLEWSNAIQFPASRKKELSHILSETA